MFDEAAYDIVEVVDVGDRFDEHLLSQQEREGGRRAERRGEQARAADRRARPGIKVLRPLGGIAESTPGRSANR